MKKLALLFIILLLFAPALANHLVGFYADKNGYWSGGVKYYVYKTSDVQFNVEDNGGDGLSLINGGVVVYRVDQNGDELVAVQCNQEELQNPDGICNNYDVAANGKLAWSWDQKYYTGNQKKDDANNDGINDFVPEGKYYGIIITTPHKNYAAGTTQYETQNFVLDLDDDGDTIPNGADKCPQTFGAGNGDALGCLDGDNDGVPDEKDKCLDRPETINGYLDSDGCPDELFAGGPPQGRCSGEVCKQVALKNEARRAGQVEIIAEAAGTLLPFIEHNSIEPSVLRKLWLAGIAYEAYKDYFIVQRTKKLIEDPPDPNYKVVVTIKRTQIKPLNETDEEMRIINTLLLSGRDYADAVDAFVAANEKYLGAKEANDEYWMNVHSQEVRKYAALAATTLDKNNKDTVAFELFILKNNANVVITKNDLIKLQNRLGKLGANALPAEEIDLLKNNFGGNDSDVQNLVNSVLSINPTTWIDEPITNKIEQSRKANEKLIAEFQRIGRGDFQYVLLYAMIGVVSIMVITYVIKYKFKKW